MAYLMHTHVTIGASGSYLPCKVGATCKGVKGTVVICKKISTYTYTKPPVAVFACTHKY